MSIPDSAVGAVLQIPPRALRDILRAGRYITNLQIRSKRAADAVADHWGKTAVGGLDSFIQKLSDAQQKMKGFGDININLNVNGAQSQMQSAVNVVQNGAAQISDTLQKAAQVGWEGLNKNPKPKWLDDYAESLGLNLNVIRDVKNAIKQLSQEQEVLDKRSKTGFNDSGITVQQYSNAIGYLQEYLKYLKETTAAKNRLAAAESDKAAHKSDQEYLNRQKEAYKQILDLRKQINDQKIKIAQGEITKSSTLEKDKRDLLELQERLKMTGRAWNEYNTESRRGELSTDGALQARNAQLNMQNKMLKEQRVSQEELNKAIVRGNEVTSQTQANKARLGNTQEAAIQRQLNSDYKELLRIIKERGEIQAKAAAEGRNLNQSEINLLATLRDRYKLFYEDIQRVSDAYRGLSEASAAMFREDKSLQKARNATLIADAERKAEEATRKRADADAKAEERAIAAGEKKIAQREAQIAREEAANRKAATDYEKVWLAGLAKKEAAERKAAETAQKQAALPESRNQTIIEAKLNGLRVLAERTSKMIDEENRKLAESQKAANDASAAITEFFKKNPTFNLRDAENQIKDLQQKIDAIKAKAATQGPTKGSITLAAIKPLEQQMAPLVALVNELNGLNNKSQQTFRTASIAAQLYSQNISVLNSTAARTATEITELESRQKKLNREFEKGNTVRSLLSEYKQLQSTIQTLGTTMSNFRSAGGDISSASYQAMMGQLQTFVARETEIRKMGIVEIEQYRQQKANAAYAADLSAFIQNEAAKTAEAKRQASKQAQDRLEKYKQSINTYAGAMRQYNALGTSGGVYADTFENRERVIKNLEAAIKSLNKADSDYKNKLDALTSALHKLKAAQKEVSDAMKPTKPMVSPQDAINAANNARTLKDLQNAYKQLKEVMANTKPNDPQWNAMNATLRKTKEQIDKIRKAMGELRVQSERINGIAGQLRNQIATVFSVSAITGYLKKMVEVRAQFELQQVALRAIIRDKDEADRIFSQIQNMALQSPFTIMQLTTYSKQLAAYNIEAEKLVDTTKMLADVSAGLGVDFGRLSLAFGQVKSANFLRATELRQFTEAGLNMGKELANYYSEIEKRTVTIGDVMDMISKRMVRFEDVEEVFRRVTSAGGMFYDMQKKQSESLHGQIQRISDAYSIMMNDIGKSNEGTIGKALTFIRSMISHWRMVVPLLKTIGGLMLSVMVPRTIIAMVGAVQKLNAALAATLQNIKWISNASKFASMATGIGAVIAVVTTLLSVFAGLKEEANALNEEMSRIGGEAVNDMKDSIANFLTLADAVTDTSKSYAEQKDALDNLVSGYGEYIDKQKLTSEYLTKLKGDYSELTDEIRRHYAEVEYQNKMDAISNSQQFKDAQTQMREVGQRMFNEGIFDESVSKKAVEQWMDVVTQELASGKLENSAQAIASRLQKIFGNSMGDISKYMSESINNADFTDMVDKVKPLQDEIDNLSLSTIGASTHQEAFNNSLSDMPVDTASRMYDSLSESIRKYQDSIASEKLGQLPSENAPIISQNAIDASNQRIAEYSARIEQLKQQQLELNEVIATRLGETVYDEVNNGALEFKVTTDGVTETLTLNQSKLKDQLTAYFNLAKEIRDVKATGEKYDGQLAELEKQQDACWISTEKMSRALGVDLKRDALDAARTTFDFNTIINEVSTKALPSFLKAAMKAFSNPQLALLKLEKYFANFAKKVNTMFGVELFEGISSWSDDVDGLYEKMRKEAEDAASQQADTLESFNDKIQKEIAADFGVDASFFNNYTKAATQSNQQYAETLRKNAKELKNEYKSYQKAVQQGTEEAFLKNNNRTKAELERIGKEADALEKYADTLYPKLDKEKKGGKGADPWQKRVQLFKELNTEYEKLLQNYSKEESKQRIQKSYAQAIAEIYKGQGKFGKAESWMGFDKATMIKIGQEMLDTLQISPDKRKELEKQLASMKAEVDIQIQKDAVDKLKKDMQNVADDFELSETFRNLGVSADITYSLGGKPTTLADWRKTLEDNFRQAYLIEEKYGKEGVKAYEDALKEIAKKEQENLEERAKNYIKYLTESLGERAQIEVKAMQDINKIRNDETLDQFSKDQAIMQRRKKMQEDLNKVDLDSLKSSDVYISVFKDLENASKDQLQYVINKLRELQSTFKDLSPAQVKSIANDLKKLEDAMAEHDSFKSISSDIKEIIDFQKNRNELLREQALLQSQLDTAQQNVKSNEVALAEAQMKLNSIANKNSDEYKEQEEVVRKLQMALSLNQSVVAKTKEDLGKITEDIDKGTSATERLKKTWEKISKIMDATSSLIGDLSEGLENMGLMTDALKDGFESATSILSNVSQIGTGAVQAFTDPNPINKVTGAIQALGGVIKLVGNIFNIGDKKKERKIKKLQEKVEDLGKAYEKLHNSIEEAYTFDDYNAGYKASMDNLNEQKRAYEEMIRLEEAKKKTDKDKVKEYKDALEDIAKAEKQLHDERIEAQGSTTDYLSEAQNFVSAWLDAYKETGNGLDALTDQWDEFIENLFVKQGAAQLVSTRLKKVIDMINDAIDAGGTDFNLAETVNKAREEWNKEAEIINPLLEQLFGSYGLGKGNGEFVLSDLQKGIQNITEPQAAAIEAYLNSMRFAVFRHTEQLDALIAAVTMQYGVGENPMIAELKGIRAELSDIHTTLRSVIKQKVGRGYVVQID